MSHDDTNFIFKKPKRPAAQDAPKVGAAATPPPIVAKPFFKWAGGKRKQAKRIADMLLGAWQVDDARGTAGDVDTYVEPFLGAGAVFFEIANREISSLKRVVLADVNVELIAAMRAVQTSALALMTHMQDERFQNDEAAFKKIRTLDPANLTVIEKAARFLYLNKTCFNGLYRTNAKGTFNVPFGKTKTSPPFYDEAVFTAARARLRGVYLFTQDFVKTFEEVTNKTAIYCDPPYVPVSKTASFTGYSADGFGEEHQEKLARYALRAVKGGARVVLSNADVPLVRKLYPAQWFSFEEVKAPRAINSKGALRGDVSELLIVGRRTNKT